MPQKNRIKVYVKNSIYHVYNRGVEKRKIFQDEQDHEVFLHLLKYYLSPLDQNPESYPLKGFSGITIVRPRPLENLVDEVKLLAYCLMPNHFHLLIKQISETGMTRLLQKLLTIYSMYFNKKYDRVGHLFQGPYRAVLVEKDEYLLHLSRYIHLNPSELTGPGPVNYPFSSYGYYLGEKNAPWIHPNLVLSYFENPDRLPFLKGFTYKEFVEGSTQDAKEILGELTLE